MANLERWHIFEPPRSYLFCRGTWLLAGFHTPLSQRKLNYRDFGNAASRYATTQITC